MRRALILILSLTILCAGMGLWVDFSQRNTARTYLSAVQELRETALQGKLDTVAADQTRLYERWEKDAGWLNCIISHHHTRAVGTAMKELSTALEQRLPEEILRAFDKLEDALTEVEGSDFPKLENIL